MQVGTMGQYTHITQGNEVLTTHRMTPGRVVDCPRNIVQQCATGRVAHKDAQVGDRRNCGWVIHKNTQVDTKWVILWIHRVHYMWEVGVGWWVGGIYSNNWGHGDSEEPMWGHTHTHIYNILCGTDYVSYKPGLFVSKRVSLLQINSPLKSSSKFQFRFRF